MISKEEALQLLDQNIENRNLKRHCYAVAATMKALAKHFNEDENTWEITGLIHDIDYEKFPEKHPLEGAKILEEKGLPKEVVEAVIAHGWGYHNESPEPKNNLEWSLYCCDELTGFIVAVTLVMPEKKLEAVTPEAILKKFPQKAFAAKVNREQIALCEEKLEISLDEFVKITLEAMKGISKDLGL